jgi:two-component system chemotaxis response regulator CheB
MKPIKVMIVEDSPVMRNFLTERIGNAADFEVVATAHDGADAHEKLLAEGPDVITLDVELPDMNGIDVLERIMKTRPTPVVMVSGLTQSGALTTLRALQAGAVDFVGKPVGTVKGDTDAWIGDVLLKLRRAASIRPSCFLPTSVGAIQIGEVHEERVSSLSARKCQEKVILVGGGSGATEAVRKLLSGLPRDCPAMLIALQCSPVITHAMLGRLGRENPLQFKLATDGEVMARGHVYLGSGDTHVGVIRQGAQWHIKLHPGEPIRGYRPSLDWMFESASKYLGQEIAGVLLDAAGDDGIVGLRFLAANHSRAFMQAREEPKVKQVQAQRLSSSYRSFAVEPVVLPLERIPAALLGA